VAVSDIDDLALEAVAEAIRMKRVAWIAIPADLSDAASTKRAMNRLIQVFSRPDLVFANARTNGTWAPI
jgi:NAD(P)-dependent dehydrogenase (short-subunit alcohol dehydrogenase family)